MLQPTCGAPLKGAASSMQDAIYVVCGASNTVAPEDRSYAFEGLVCKMPDLEGAARLHQQSPAHRCLSARVPLNGKAPSTPTGDASVSASVSAVNTTIDECAAHLPKKCAIPYYSPQPGSSRPSQSDSSLSVKSSDHVRGRIGLFIDTKPLFFGL